MAEHRFGEMVGDPELGGTFELGASVALEGYSTVAVDNALDTGVPVVGLRMAGRQLSSGDIVEVVWVLPMMDAGKLVGALCAAMARIGTEEAASDFRVGVSLGETES